VANICRFKFEHFVVFSVQCTIACGSFVGDSGLTILYNSQIGWGWREEEVFFPFVSPPETFFRVLTKHDIKNHLTVAVDPLDV